MLRYDKILNCLAGQCCYLQSSKISFHGVQNLQADVNDMRNHYNWEQCSNRGKNGHKIFSWGNFVICSISWFQIKILAHIWGVVIFTRQTHRPINFYDDKKLLIHYIIWNLWLDWIFKKLAIDNWNIQVVLCKGVIASPSPAWGR